MRQFLLSVDDIFLEEGQTIIELALQNSFTYWCPCTATLIILSMKCVNQIFSYIQDLHYKAYFTVSSKN